MGRKLEVEIPGLLGDPIVVPARAYEQPDPFVTRISFLLPKEHVGIPAASTGILRIARAATPDDTFASMLKTYGLDAVPPSEPSLPLALTERQIRTFSDAIADVIQWCQGYREAKPDANLPGNWEGLTALKAELDAAIRRAA